MGRESERSVNGKAYSTSFQSSLSFMKIEREAEQERERVEKIKKKIVRECERGRFLQEERTLVSPLTSSLKGHQEGFFVRKMLEEAGLAHDRHYQKVQP